MKKLFKVAITYHTVIWATDEEYATNVAANEIYFIVRDNKLDPHFDVQELGEKEELPKNWEEGSLVQGEMEITISMARAIREGA